MKKYYILICALLITNIVCLYNINKNICSNACAIEGSKESTKQESSSRWEANVKKNDNFVFLGDSIFDWYPIKEMYDSSIPIVNSGRAGYETQDILDRMDEMVYRYNPTKVFILIGTNDLNYEDDDEQKVADNIEKIVELIKENRPTTKIYLQSIYPINRNMENHGAQERYNDEIQEVNSRLKDYCKKNDVTYIDMYDVLKDDDGNFKEEYTKDGLHPSTLGYIAITKKLMEYMN